MNIFCLFVWFIIFIFFNRVITNKNVIGQPIFFFFLISWKKKGSLSPHMGQASALALILSLQFLQYRYSPAFASVVLFWFVVLSAVKPVGSLQYGHVFALASMSSPHTGQLIVSFVVGGVSSHSPQCLHFLAMARISSPQYGHRFFSSISMFNGSK